MLVRFGSPTEALENGFLLSRHFKLSTEDCGGAEGILTFPTPVLKALFEPLCQGAISEMAH